MYRNKDRLVSAFDLSVFYSLVVHLWNGLGRFISDNFGGSEHSIEKVGDFCQDSVQQKLNPTKLQNSLVRVLISSVQYELSPLNVFTTNQRCEQVNNNNNEQQQQQQQQPDNPLQVR